MKCWEKRRRSGFRLSHVAVMAPLISLALMAVAAPPAYAHGFGQRYDLPVPLWLYIAGAGSAVALSFVIVGVFVKGTPGLHGYPTLNLLRYRPGRWLAHPVIVWSLKLVSMAVLALVVASGLFGTQKPVENIAPTMVWVIWWVGIAYVSALLGNAWRLVNPWATLFGWADALYRRINPGDELSSSQPYPARLGYWPAFALFLLFAWVEIVYPGSAEPRSIATMVVVYTFITLGGMVVYGKHAWLKYGETFSVVFGLLARFAPTEVAVRGREVCHGCTAQCEPTRERCLNCYECFAEAHVDQRELNLRPYGAGLLLPDVAWPSLMALVVLVLSTVTFDGFTATPLWADIVGGLVPLFKPLGSLTATGIRTFGVLVFPIIFLAVYAAFSFTMAGATGSVDRWGAFARVFVFSLIPIALAYHLAHFLSFLLIQGQLVIPLLSDPLGSGWNLLGTADYQTNIAIVNARFAWITSVVAIVIGHIVAVYVAHVAALRLLPERGLALRSQYPMLVLMVGYTMVSLWIIAQPIVEDVA